MGCCAICPKRQPDEYAVFCEGKDDNMTGSNDANLYGTSNAGLSNDTNEIDVISVKHVKRISDRCSYSECILRTNDIQSNERNSGDEADINDENKTGDSIKRRTDINIGDRRTDIESGYKSGYLDRLSAEHEKMIQRNYRFLLENLMAKCITPWLVQKRILCQDDEIEIRKSLTERASAELLLQKLIHSKPESFETFLEVLRATKQAFIVSVLTRDDTNAQEEFPQEWTTGDIENIKRMIERKKSYILDQLHPDKILGFFVERDMLNIESIADMTFKSRNEKAKIVLDSVLHNLPFGFNLLLHALKQTESDQLASCLSKMVSGTRDVSLIDGTSNWKYRGYLECESKESKVRIQIKTTLCSGEDMEPLIDAENYLVKQIRTVEWKNVRETFFKATESVLKEATCGSLIIHLTPCSKRAYDKLLKFCQNGSFEKLLTTLLSDEKAKQFFPQGPFTVKTELLAIGLVEECAVTEVAKFRDRLIEEFDTVVDEINPMTFKRAFVDRGLLSEDYFHHLGQSLVQSRSASAADFVQKVLELGEEAVLAFKETIETNGPEYLLGVLKKDSTKVVDVRDHDVLSAMLAVQNHKSNSLDAIIFHDWSFHITMQDSIDLQRTHPTHSAKSNNTLRPQIFTVIDVGHPRKRTFDTYGTEEISISKFNARETDIARKTAGFRGSIISDYTDSSSSGFSEDSQFSHWSEADQALDLEGDLRT